MHKHTIDCYCSNTLYLHHTYTERSGYITVHTARDVYHNQRVRVLYYYYCAYGNTARAASSQSFFFRSSPLFSFFFIYLFIYIFFFVSFKFVLFRRHHSIKQYHYYYCGLLLLQRFAGSMGFPSYASLSRRREKSALLLHHNIRHERVIAFRV